MKKQEMAPKKMNNDGLTLVELLICIMILAIVSTAVFSFMMIGVRIFNRSNLEVEMQKEAQVMKNYMNDLITDTTRWIEYVTGEEAAPYGLDRCLMIYGEESVSCMGWIQSSGEIRYLEKDKNSFAVDESGAYHLTLESRESNAANWPLMAKYVTEFDCHDDQLQKEHRIFYATMGFQLQELTYHTTHTITLRNDIFYEGRTEKEYENVMGSFEAQITRITLAPGSVDKAIDRIHGTQVTFTSTVSAVGDIDKSVIYEVEGNTSSGTKMEGNVLKIARDETSAVLTVICRSVVNENISAIAIVNIASVSAVSIKPKQLPYYENLYYAPDTEIDFEAVVEGNFATEEGRNVTWTLDDIALEGTGKACTINTGAIEDGITKTMTLRAASVANPNVYAEYVVYVSKEAVEGLYIVAEEGNYSVRRGGSLQLNLVKGGNILTDGVSWRIAQSSLGERVKIDSTGKVTAQIDIAFEQKYEVIIEAGITDEDHTIHTVTSVIEIPKVEITLEPSYVIMSVKPKGNIYRVNAAVIGIDMKDGGLIYQQKPYVRKLEAWTLSREEEKAIIGLNMIYDTEKEIAGLEDYTALKISLKGYPNVYAQLPIYVYKYNYGMGEYVPVPGDNTGLVEDQDKNGVPDEECVLSVNGKVYRYYINSFAAASEPKWYIQAENDAEKYVYDGEPPVNVSGTPSNYRPTFTYLSYENWKKR